MLKVKTINWGMDFELGIWSITANWIEQIEKTIFEVVDEDYDWGCLLLINFNLPGMWKRKSVCGQKYLIPQRILV